MGLTRMAEVITALFVVQLRHFAIGVIRDHAVQSSIDFGVIVAGPWVTRLAYSPSVRGVPALVLAEFGAPVIEVVTFVPRTQLPVLAWGSRMELLVPPLLL